MQNNDECIHTAYTHINLHVTHATEYACKLYRCLCIHNNHSLYECTVEGRRIETYFKNLVTFIKTYIIYYLCTNLFSKIWVNIRSINP